MPLVLMAPTCVELNDAMSVAVKACITVVDSAAICAGVRSEIDIEIHLKLKDAKAQEAPKTGLGLRET